MSENQNPKKPLQVGDSRPSEIIIEIDTGRCQDVMFDPTKDVLRGRYESFKLSGHIDNEQERCRKLLGIQFIPGMHIALDIERMCGRIFDPLSLRENAEVARQVFDAWHQLDGRDRKPVDEQVYSDLNKDQVATWAHWMGRLVHGKKAVMRQGKLPAKPSEIGRVRVDFFDSHPQAKKYQDEFQPT